MARADLLIDIVRAGAEGNQEFFRRALEAMITEERSKQHHVLADRLAAHLQLNGHSKTTAPITPVSLNGASRPLLGLRPQRRLAGSSPSSICVAGRAHNLEPRHRLLLVAPPGNGKTSLAEALAFELAVPLLVVRHETLIGSFLGETAMRLAQLFAQPLGMRKSNCNALGHEPIGAGCIRCSQIRRHSNRLSVNGKTKIHFLGGIVSGDISSSCSEIYAFGLRKIAWRKLAFLMTGVIE